MIIPERVQARAQTNVKPVRTERGCLISRYSAGSHGYAQIGWQDADGTHGTLCHRAVWTASHGQIEDGVTVDHTCKNRMCVEITHLRLLPNLENARRTSGRDWPLGQCAQGHDHEKYWHKPPSGGKGYCNECRRLLQRRRRAEARARGPR